ncbi:plasmid replication initiator TrfA [Thiocystis violacea]|uniref:plasmid replication initiator TrfA n=1 Tax=Thiocystis violacea TaxID=13725 RepID=UPI0019069E1F|nr:plasmid replication initiator TrfA [Thiocystis violacea]
MTEVSSHVVGDDSESESKSLERTLAKLEARVAERHPKTFPKRAQINPTTTGKVVQLPIWPEFRRGVPNELVRGALFTIGNTRTPRAYRRSMVIASLSNIEINYTGEELRQDDEDVFLQLVHLARVSPLGSEVSFTAHSMLKSLKWPTNSRSYDRLRETIMRLQASGVEIRTARGGYSGSLIRDFEWREDGSGTSSRSWNVRLEPRIASLFDNVSYTQIDWDQRLRLGTLAKWLHAFYYTHQKPFPMKTGTIRTLCGSTTKDLSKFRQLLKASLSELISVGFLRSAEIQSGSDLVFVIRTNDADKLVSK